MASPPQLSDAAGVVAKRDLTCAAVEPDKEVEDDEQINVAYAALLDLDARGVREVSDDATFTSCSLSLNM